MMESESHDAAESMAALQRAAIPPVRSEPLLAFHIPADLAEAFDDFVKAACAAIDCTDRGDWADDERRIFEWMESDKWKANAEREVRT